MLVVLAGLPGAGKSTLAAALADRLGGVVLNKDRVRAELFPGPTLRYTAEQDDAAMTAVYAAASLILRDDPGRTVLVDGRTFSKRRQFDAVRAMGVPFRVVECVCADDVAERRIADDAAAGTHPAGNRTPELFRAVRARAEALDLPRLTLDTGVLPLDECVRRAAEYLGERGASAP